MQLNTHREEVERYARALGDHPEALAYLHGRGIKETTAQWWGLGYCGDMLELLGGRITFPICDPFGGVVGIGGRSIDGSEPRVWYRPGLPKKRYLYGLQVMRPCAYVVIVEGQFDAMSLDQLGYRACAVMGSNVNVLAASWLRLWTTSAIVYPDNTSSDKKAFEKALGWVPVLEKVGMKVAFPRRPYEDGSCGDPDDLARRSPGWLAAQIVECAEKLKTGEADTLMIEDIEL